MNWELFVHDWLVAISILVGAVYLGVTVVKCARDIARARDDAGRMVAEAHARAADAIERAIAETRRLSPKWAATAKPGDTLVLGFDGGITHKQFEAIRDQLREAIPAEIRFLVVSGATSMAVQRGEEA